MMPKNRIPKLLFIGFMLLLASCSKKNDPANLRQVGDLQVLLSLGGVASRSVDGSIYDQTGKGYTLPFSAVNTLKVELYESLSESVLFTHEASISEIKSIQAVLKGGAAQLFIADIPLKTKYIKVSINKFSVIDPDINHLQVTNRDTPPAPTMVREQIPYEGITSQITLSPVVSPDRETVVATVEVAPVLSRFEIKPGNIQIVDPATDGYTFGWTSGESGKAKIKGYSAAQIAAAEQSARENYKKQYGTDASATAYYAYRVRLVRQTVTSDINNWDTSPMASYVNYFKQRSQATQLVKNSNNGVDSWLANTEGGTAEYLQNGAHSNLFDIQSASLSSNQVIAYHLFPQSVAAEAPLDVVKAGMPHIILHFKNLKTNDSRWLTLRAFRDITANKIITAFKAGYCYSLALTDIKLTPWSLALEVQVNDNNKTVDSDPIVEDFDQTDNVPELEGSELMLGLTVRQWREKEIIVEL